MRKGKLIVLSGPSGTGKGTICKELIDRGVFDLSISMTTRAPRTGEAHGVHYYFASREEFEQTIRDDGFLEYARIYENYYGTPKAPVLEKLEKGIDVMLEIEMQGALQVKAHYPEAILIFVLPPDLKTLKQRLTGRGTESPAQIELRTRASLEEIRKIYDYDYSVINDRLEDAVSDVMSIIRAEHLKVGTDTVQLVKKFEEEQ